MIINKISVINVSFLGTLVAIKTDLKQRRVISTKQGHEHATSKGLEYFECSPVSTVLTLHIVWIRVFVYGRVLETYKSLEQPCLFHSMFQALS